MRCCARIQIHQVDHLQRRSWPRGQSARSPLVSVWTPAELEEFSNNWRSHNTANLVLRRALSCAQTSRKVASDSVGEASPHRLNSRPSQLVSCVLIATRLSACKTRGSLNLRESDSDQNYHFNEIAIVPRLRSTIAVKRARARAMLIKSTSLVSVDLHARSRIDANSR